jgi:hypothetical protein
MKLLPLLLLLSVRALAASSTDDLGFQAFQKTLYPRLRKSCVACHGDGGIAVGHSVSDPRIAYGNAKDFVDFSDLKDSTFVKRVRSRHWASHDPTQAGMSEADMLTALTDWWTEGEFAASQRFAYRGAGVPLPAELPFMSSGNYATVSFDLSQGEPALPGCHAMLDVQRAKAPSENIAGAYRVRNLQLSCAGTAHRLRGFRIFVSNQTAAYENIYASDEVTVPADGSAVLVDGENMVLLQRSPDDSLSLFVESVDGSR